MKYIAPKMDMKELEVEDIIMSNQGGTGNGGTGEGITPDDEF